MIRLAFVYEDNQIFVELKPDEFRKALREHFRTTKSIDKALDAVTEDIKRLTRFK